MLNEIPFDWSASYHVGLNAIHLIHLNPKTLAIAKGKE